jgi:hypothetical protein
MLQFLPLFFCIFFTYFIAFEVCLVGTTSQQSLVSKLGSKKSFGQKVKKKTDETLKEKHGQHKQCELEQCLGTNFFL